MAARTPDFGGPPDAHRSPPPHADRRCRRILDVLDVPQQLRGSLMGNRSPLRHILDPLGGDVLDHPDRRLRLNLRRVEILCWLAIAVAVLEGSLAPRRGLPEMIWLCLGLGSVAAGLLGLARHAQRTDAGRFRLLPEVAIVSVLLGSQSMGYLISLTERLATGYGLCAIACAALFLVPPRRFAAIGLATLAVYWIWLSLAGFSLFDTINGIVNTSLAVAVAILGRYGIDRLERTSERQTQRIAEQNAALNLSNARLEAANAALAAANTQLGALMAVAAHDLRSPLYGLGNLLELAAAHPPATDQDWQEMLREAGNGIAAMQALIGRILDAHEAESRDDLAVRRCDLVLALQAAARRSGATARQCRVELRLEPVAAPVIAWADPDGIDQILDNLVSNAIRFSPPGAVVDLVAGTTPRPFVELRDRGIGVPAPERADLFGKFRRGSLRPVNGAKGSGLGLYIVATLAAAMQARARYRPRDGGGSVFTVEFHDP